jgi:hypothetical protein
MKTSLFTLLVSVLLTQTALTQGWEQLYTMPAVVAGATSAASEGYGVHLVGVYSGVAKHFWVGNDNTVVWSTLAVTAGQQPQVTSHDGQVRVAMKIIDGGVQKLRIYQSDDGGYAWTLLPEFTPPNNPPIFHLYAYSDRYGTHIVWDNTEADNDHNKEVYYVRCNPQAQFENFRNVTELSSPSQGAGPKVAVVGNKACVAFTSNSWQLTSRDLNLDSGEWDSFYRSQTGSSVPYANVNIASIGQRFYVMGISDLISCINCCFRSAIFAYRDVSDMSWPSSTQFCSGGGSLNKPNSLIASGGKLHFISMPSTDINPQGPQAWSYDPAQGFWSGPETIESYTGEQNANSLMLTGGQFGNYYFFTGTYPSFHQHMRRKAFVPNVTLNSGVASGWNMTGIPNALFNLFKSQVYPTSNSSAFRFEGGYVVTDPLSLRHGWWIKFPSAQSISYTGARTDSMRMIVYNGWNIIGSISSTIPIQAPNVTSDPPGIIISAFQTYQNGGYVIANSIVPGLGYWVRTSEAGRIVLRVGGSGQGGGEEMASYDRFTLTDAEGNTQDLYVRNASLVGTVESLEMPPAPPDAEFDARFTSGDIVRTVDPEGGVVDLSIDVNEAAYPVTLSWEINPENGISYSFNGGGLGRAAHTGGDGGLIGGAQLSSGGNLVLASGAGRRIHLSGQSQRMGVPQGFTLHQNYPNPFNPETKIRFDLPQEARVDVAVFDLLGRRVSTLVSGPKAAGTHSVVFSASGLSSGVYFYQLQAEPIGGAGTSFREIKKLVLVR